MMYRLFVRALVVFFFSVHTGFTVAGPWIEVGDEELRHHIQVLASAGVISTPHTTYPLMWSNIERDLRKNSAIPLSAAQLWSLAFVNHEFKRQTDAIAFQSYAAIRSDVPIQRNFGDKIREKGESGLGLSWLGNRFSANVSLSVNDSKLDNQEYRFDGSYVAAVVGNWAVSVGAFDRWWGPGWQNSLILSNNARPVPGVGLQRNYAEGFQTKWLSWLGPWTVSAFAGILERDRAIPEAKLLGLRVNFKPTQNLEIGLSRTAQWGGEGRPETLDAFVDLTLGRDNRGQAGVTEENEPGNQLAGIDFRYSKPMSWGSAALYGQAIGEDAAGVTPSRLIYLGGLETAVVSASMHSRYSIEGSYTEASNGDFPNFAYEHNSIYLNGYRYRSRAIGAALDNDTLALTLAGEHFFGEGNQISWRISQVELNRDNSNAARSEAGGNSVSETAVDYTFVELSYKKTVNKKTKIGVSAFYQSENVQLRNTAEEVGSGFSFSVERKW